MHAFSTSQIADILYFSTIHKVNTKDKEGTNIFWNLI